MPRKKKKRTPAETPLEVSASAAPAAIRPWMIYAGLFLLVAAIFWPVIHYPFINLDNQEYITQNPVMYLPFSWKSVEWAFIAVRTGDWQPLVWLSFFLDRRLFDFNAGGYHFTNLFLYLLNVLLIFRVFSKATGKFWASAAVAALYAVHPLRVESVAWIAERKDVLSGLFWWLTIDAYFDSRQKNSLKLYGLSVFYYVLAVLSKPVVVSLPLMLLLFDFWPMGRFRSGVPLRKLLAEKVPFVLLAVFSAVMTLKAHKVIGALVSLQDVNFIDRVANAAVSLYLYLQKTVWPFGLAIAYPFPNPQAKMPVFVMACLAGFAFLTFWVWKQRKERPFLLFGWLWYLITVGPVLGLVHISAQAMADRYMYLPHVGIAVMAVWSFASVFEDSKWRAARTTVFTGLLAFFSLASVRQLGFWKSPLALNEHAVTVVPENYFAYGGLGFSYMKNGDLDKALWAYEKALSLHKTARTLSNVGSIYIAKKEYDKAIPYFEKALKYNPRSVTANHNLGLIYLMKKDEERALFHMKKAARRERQTSRARVALANVYMEKNEIEKAAALLEPLQRSFPGNGPVRFLRGQVMQAQGDIDGAIEMYRKAVWGKPRSYRAIHALSLILLLRGDYEETRVFLREVIESEPSYVPAYLNLANALMGLGRYDDAIEWLQRALAINPKSAEAQRILKSAREAKENNARGQESPVPAPESGLEISTPADFQNLLQMLAPSTSQR